MAAVMATAMLVLGSTSALADPTIDSATNAYRVANGRPALSTSAGLTSVAATRAQQVVSNFAHPSSWQWLFDAVPGCESAIGENIAWHSNPVPAGWPVSAWIVSPLHRDNMLRAWTHQGSATFRTTVTVVNPDGTTRLSDRTYAVQLFSKACGVAPAPAPVPAPPIVDTIPDTSMSPAN